MFLDLALLAWIAWGLYGLYRFNRTPWPSSSKPSAKEYTTVTRSQGPVCTHPRMEQVEIGDGILVPLELVAKICTSCFAQLPADYSSPSSVIITNENSVPSSACNITYSGVMGGPVSGGGGGSGSTIGLSYWTESQERLATGKEVNQCHG